VYHLPRLTIFSKEEVAARRKMLTQRLQCLADWAVIGSMVMAAAQICFSRAKRFDWVGYMAMITGTIMANTKRMVVRARGKMHYLEHRGYGQ